MNFSPLNILNENMAAEYLSKIPSSILNKLLVNGHLYNFYLDMEKHLLGHEPCIKKQISNYNHDKVFTNTIRCSQNKLDLPFWWHLRRATMSEKTIQFTGFRMAVMHKRESSYMHSNL